MNDIDQFKATIEKFIEDRGMTPTMFGKLFAADPNFVFGIRAGREPRTQIRKRIIDAMNASHVSAEAAQ